MLALSIVASLVLAAPVDVGGSTQVGVLSPPLGEPLGQSALRFAQSRGQSLGLSPRATLAVGPQFSTRLGGTVHLVEQVDGLEVWGARVQVTVDTLRRVVRVSSSLRPFGAVKSTATLSGPQALALAAREVDGAMLRDDGAPWGGFRALAFVVDGEVHAGFLTMVPTLRAGEAWHVAVDAVEGRVLWVENRAHSNAGDARVWPSSPGGLSSGGIHAGLTSVVLPLSGSVDGGYLSGERVRIVNCCPTADCVAGGTAKRAQGTLQTFGGMVTYDMAICDRRPRATNDVAVHASGDFVYAPVDPPTTQRPSSSSPADFDEFAEVHAFFHVNKVYDAVRALSVGPLTTDGGLAAFEMRHNDAGTLPAVWVNASDPDLQGATQNAAGVLVADSMVRVDNAMFVALELMDGLALPQQHFDSDALVIYQGNTADFAYDGPVLWHEFGHGVIHSTANWGRTVTLDARSANDESSALHEGMADLIAAMTGNDPVVGRYVGPRIDATMQFIRDVDNTYRCPDVLWGESHQDSMHFTGAVWEARTKYFQGLDQGRTFDAAVYAALVSFPTDVNFEKAAGIITHSVSLAFPARTDAASLMDGVFRERGVVGCSKLLEVDWQDPKPRTYYGVPGTTFAGVADNSAVPGPYQFKVHAGFGALSLTVTAPYASFGTATTARAQVLASRKPITFTLSGATLTNDAEVMVVPTLANQQMTGKVTIDVPCGGDVYFTVANTSRRDRPFQNLAFTLEPHESCPLQVVDAGPPPAIELPVAGDTLGAPVQGCGCGATEGMLGLAALVVVSLRRRQAGRR